MKDIDFLPATPFFYNLSYEYSIVTLLEVTQLTFVFPGLSFRFTCQPFVHNLGIEQKQAPASWPVSCRVAWSPHLGIDSQTLTPGRVWSHNDHLPMPVYL